MYGEKKQIRDSSRSVLVGRENFGNNICYFDGNCIKSSNANINAGVERRFHVQTNVSQTTTNLLYMTDDQIKQSQQITTSEHYDWKLCCIIGYQIKLCCARKKSNQVSVRSGNHLEGNSKHNHDLQFTARHVYCERMVKPKIARHQTTCEDVGNAAINLSALSQTNRCSNHRRSDDTCISHGRLVQVVDGSGEVYISLL
jgi:hypothetical protein